ncbi:MAG: putative selenate ABC transporter substrate-binding protein [Hyphomicrobiaceae bacterium]|nr:putative selenate ABC transporter substrate-binding protein [Hyphomicrobiaceae bacterium]
MRVRRSGLELFVFLLAILTTLGAASAQTKTLVFTAIPDQDETRLAERFAAYAKYFESKLGVAVTYLPVKSYPAAVTAFASNQVQLAWFGGFTGVQARRASPGAEAIAQGIEDVKFTSYFIANASTGLVRGPDFPKAIAGKTFTFGARTSTSGRVFPEHFIRQALGKGPDEVFPTVGFSGDHSRTAQLVQSGAFQVGAVDHLTFDREVAAGKVDPKKVVIIWETPTFPDYHWVVRGDVDGTFGAGFKARLQQAILAIDDPKLLQVMDRKKFIPASNADYKVIEDVGGVAGLLN